MVTKGEMTAGDLSSLSAAQAGDWSDWDRVVVAFSGGKDSLACVLKLLDLGCPKSKLELWHHDVDGGHSAERFMDWPITAGYVRAVAAALDLPVFFSWKARGFLGEMMRDATPTAPTTFERPVAGAAGESAAVLEDSAGGRGPDGTRLKFPAISADLNTRWCSAYLKIDVAARVFSNDPRFARGRFLLVTGERRQESKARSRYLETEYHRSHSRRRTVVQWRAVIDLTEADVWTLIQRHGVAPHPAYRLGFGRVSCAFCIFGNPDQFATARALLPLQFERVAVVEDQIGYPLRKGVTLREWADRGTRYGVGGDSVGVSEAAVAVRSSRFTLPVLQGDAWQLPAGAFKECGGPT